MSDCQFNPNQEQWKEIPGFPGYEVSDQGRVRSYWRANGSLPGGFGNPVGGANITDKPQRVLKPGMSKTRLFVFLGKGNIFSVHRLVLSAFIGPCPQGMEGAHNDGNPFNNFLSNLRWDTHKGNHNDRLSHGTSNKGEKHGLSKLNNQDIIKIHQYRQKGLSQQSIANLFNISQSRISLILRGIGWNHIAIPKE